MLEKLQECQDRFEAVNEMLADPATARQPQEYQKLAREVGELREVVEVGARYRELETSIGEAEEIIADGSDADLVELACSEIEQLRSEREALEDKLKQLLIPRDPNDARNAIIEIRSGAGGDEAGLFAADLCRLYGRYAERNSWKVEPLSTSLNPSGGFKEAVFMISGKDVFGRLKYESGVHRVQRVPKTEASGRIHTSAASVAVLPEAEDVDIEIAPEDLQIDVYRSSGPGGQSVNTTDSAVRITHVPTGTVVSCQDEKSQLKNKNKALKVLRARLLDVKRAAEEAKISETRREQIGSGDRSAKIRTYNFPQGRVTDHRVKLSLHRLDEVLDGDLDEIVETLTLASQDEALQNATADES